MSNPDKLNGSVNLLAQALHKVVSEAVEVGNGQLKEDIGTLLGQNAGLEKSIVSLTKDVKTDRENNQAQFRQVHKTLGQLLSKQ